MSKLQRAVEAVNALEAFTWRITAVQAWESCCKGVAGTTGFRGTNEGSIIVSGMPSGEDSRVAHILCVHAYKGIHKVKRPLPHRGGIESASPLDVLQTTNRP